jgi:hypothetical protein
MGLGKTLSMVATIVAAMPDAQKFTKVPLTTLLTTGADRRPVKSTLIIVPSACMIPGVYPPQSLLENTNYWS